MSDDERRQEPGGRAIARFQRQLNAGTVGIAVLALLERADRPMYGYELAKVLEAVVTVPLPMKSGTLYPVLRSLEREGLLSSSMGDSESGPARRYYRVTATGKRVLPGAVVAWKTTRDFVEDVLTGEDTIRRVVGSMDGAEGAQQVHE